MYIFLFIPAMRYSNHSRISGTKFSFYAINDQLEPLHLPELNKNEHFLYINYFDLKRTM